MSSHSDKLEIAGLSVSTAKVGEHTVGTVDVGNGVTVMFQIKGGAGGTGTSTGCLSCQISKITACANLVCPEIKKADPNASCSDAIRQCIDLACAPACKNSAVGGGFLILA
jgi:hypothetical protein